MGVLSQAYGRWTWKAPKCTGEKPPQAANHAAWAMNVLAPQKGGGYEEVAYLFVYGGMGERNASIPVVHCLDVYSEAVPLAQCVVCLHHVPTCTLFPRTSQLTCTV